MTSEELTFDVRSRKDAIRCQCQENPGQALGDPLHFTRSTGSPDVTEPGALDWKDYHQTPKKEQQGASSLKIPVPKQPDGDRLQSTFKDESDMINLLSQLIPNLATRAKTHYTVTWSLFARDCMCASSEKLRRTPEDVRTVLSQRRWIFCTKEVNFQATA